MMDHKKKILLVCSPYYKDITSNLIKGASDFLKSKSVDYKILNVPGALEIAPAIKLMSDRSKKKPIFDGYVALGCVIRGETYHFEIVANESARGIQEASCNKNIPCINGILTVENEIQAFERSVSKGRPFAQALIHMVDLSKSLE